MERFDKYHYYLNSVQDVEANADFIENVYRDVNRKGPKTLREDFCGTHMLCCSWVERGPEYLAFGVDNDSEPIGYGKKYYQASLPLDQRRRVKIKKADVLDSKLPKADIITALNFSYCGLRTREELKRYFKGCVSTLNRGGVLVLDCFGGTESMVRIEETTRYQNFIYYWEQEHFDPVTHHLRCHIHYKRPGEKKRQKVFSYDWRVWTLPELRDLMKECGFRKNLVYWEGINEARGEGDGSFYPTDANREQNSDSWVAFVVGVK